MTKLNVIGHGASLVFDSTAYNAMHLVFHSHLELNSCLYKRFIIALNLCNINETLVLSKNMALLNFTSFSVCNMPSKLNRPRFFELNDGS